MITWYVTMVSKLTAVKLNSVNIVACALLFMF